MELQFGTDEVLEFVRIMCEKCKHLTVKKINKNKIETKILFKQQL
jgi:hypothetical protein